MIKKNETPFQNTQNNSGSVEQHRLKCSIGAYVGSMNDHNATKSGNNFPSNGGMMDRQWLHVSNSVRILQSIPFSNNN